jgi:hypothetical protein
MSAVDEQSGTIVAEVKLFSKSVEDILTSKRRRSLCKNHAMGMVARNCTSIVGGFGCQLNSTSSGPVTTSQLTGYISSFVNLQCWRATEHFTGAVGQQQYQKIISPHSKSLSSTRRTTAHRSDLERTTGDSRTGASRQRRSSKQRRRCPQRICGRCSSEEAQGGRHC